MFLQDTIVKWRWIHLHLQTWRKHPGFFLPFTATGVASKTGPLRWESVSLEKNQGKVGGSRCIKGIIHIYIYMLSCMYDESNICSPSICTGIIYQMLAICTGLHICMRMVDTIGCHLWHCNRGTKKSGEMPRMFWMYLLKTDGRQCFFPTNLWGWLHITIDSCSGVIWGPYTSYAMFLI